MDPDIDEEEEEVVEVSGQPHSQQEPAEKTKTAQYDEYALFYSPIFFLVIFS